MANPRPVRHLILHEIKCQKGFRLIVLEWLDSATRPLEILVLDLGMGTGAVWRAVVNALSVFNTPHRTSHITAMIESVVLYPQIHSFCSLCHCRKEERLTRYLVVQTSWGQNGIILSSLEVVQSHTPYPWSIVPKRAIVAVMNPSIGSIACRPLAPSFHHRAPQHRGAPLRHNLNGGHG